MIQLQRSHVRPLTVDHQVCAVEYICKAVSQVIWCIEMNQFLIEINSYLTCYELVISGGFQKLSDTNCISKISQICFMIFFYIIH